MNPRIFTLATLTTAISMQLFSIQTQANTPELEPMEEMIVTGSRVLERIDEVPVSVTIINADTISDELKINPELSALLAIRVPGMAPSSGSTSNAGQTLRGRPPLILIDGVPQSTPLRNGSLGIRSIDPSVIERIEVIKGATSIYGNGAGGGVINYITKPIDDSNPVNGDFGISTNFSTGTTSDTFGTRIQAGINGGIGNFRYLISGAMEDNGVQRDAEGDAIGLVYGRSDLESENLHVKLGYQFNDNNAIEVSYNLFDGQQKTDYVNVFGNANSGQKTYAIKNGETLPGEPQGPDGNENIMLKYTSDDWFGHTNFTLDGYQQTINNVFFFSTQLADYDAGYTGGQSRIVSEKKGVRANFNTHIDIAGVETTLVYGVDMINDSTYQDLVDGRIWVPEMDMNNVAPYLQAKFIFSDNWIFKAGVRKESIDISLDNYSTLNRCSAVGVCTGSVDVTGGDLSYDATTYNVGLRYNGIEAFSPFLSYSEGFNISDLGRLLRAATVTNINQVQTEASVIENREIGFSGKYNNLSYEFAYYESESELGTSNTFNSNTGFYEPVRAPQSIWGYEAAISYSFSDELTVGATYTWTEGKNEKADVYLTGREISPPKFTAYMDWQVLDNMAVSFDWLHVSERDRFEPLANGNYVGAEGPVSGYDLVNFKADYQMNSINLFVGIENLFDADYYPPTSEAFTYSGYNAKGRGRWMTLGMNYNF